MSNNKRKFNYIYTEIVKDINDVHSCVTYSIYKSKKVAFIQDYVKQKKKEPTENKIAEFHNTSRQNIDSYKSQANDILKEFIEISTKELRKEIVKNNFANIQNELDTINKRLDETEKILKQRKKIFNINLWQSVAGTFLSALLVYIILKLYKSGLLTSIVDYFK